VYIGYVVGLDYSNPYMSPYKEFQVRCLATHTHTYIETDTHPRAPTCPHQHTCASVYNPDRGFLWPER
jgi:hypothetical protein